MRIIDKIPLWLFISTDIFLIFIFIIILHLERIL